MENKLNQIMQTTMTDIKNMAEVNNIVGTPILTADGITLVPLSKMSFAFGGGGGEGNEKQSNFGGGSAAGAKIEPIGFLVIKEGGVKMLNVQPPAQNSVERVLDLVPQVIDSVETLIDRGLNQ